MRYEKLKVAFWLLVDTVKLFGLLVAMCKSRNEPLWMLIPLRHNRTDDEYNIEVFVIVKFDPALFCIVKAAKLGRLKYPLLNTKNLKLIVCTQMETVDLDLMYSYK